ncbi:MAG: hypothetical protein D6687_09130 [Acidobacteria bacterium]|jgi:NifU-like protein|nr:MAG: hypothetical protein D6687_09130 [Acidobacteriota bacterium]GIU82299.1 MAG: hypothetical protein KatS3mg006_1363 [Pyrinomonadaceae bacterium]
MAYPQKIISRLQNIKNAGEPKRVDCIGKDASFACGTAVQFALQIDKTEKRIIQAKFKTNGCGFAVAIADLLAEIITDKTLADLKGLERENLSRVIQAEFGELPSEKRQCLEMVLTALKAAFMDFRNRQIEEFAGEKALVCSCFGISEDTIEKLISGRKAKTVEDVGKLCRAGTGCGSCRFLIQEMLDSVLQVEEF